MDLSVTDVWAAAPPRRCPPRHAAWLVLVAWLLGGGAVWAQASAAPGPPAIQVGFAGILKVGHWNPLRWRIDPAWRDTGKFLEIRALDSDSVPCWYRWPLQIDSQDWADGLFYLGRPRSDLELRVVDADGQALGTAHWPSERSRNSSSSDETIVPPTTRVFLHWGIQLTPDQVIPAGGSAAGWKFVHSPDFSSLPTAALAYDPVDCVALNLPAGELLRNVTPAQIAALRAWVENGGHLVLTVPEQAGELFARGGLLETFAPGEFQGTTTLVASDSLEFYAQPANQLLAQAGQTLPVCRFATGELPVEVRQDDLALVIRRPLGFGRVSLIALDIQHPLVLAWNGRTRLLNRVLNWGEPANLAATSSSDLAARFGYSDLSGQLRAATDRFSRVGLVTFTTIALLIGLYLLWIGPGDYFFLRHVVRRMEWTWVTFLLATFLFCGLAWWIVQRNKPGERQVNQVEVVDIDGTSQAVRGTLWANVYSPATAALGLNLPQRTASGLSIQQRVLNSFGLAGRGLGGMQAANQTPLFSQPYLCQLDDAGAPLLQEVPIAIAATKPLSGRWRGEHAFRDLSELEYYARANSLSGSVRNPLASELRKCVLLYGNRAYAWDRIPAGGSAQVEQALERSLKVFLQAGQGDIDAARWNVGDRNLSRVAEMMLFFQAAGGANFTGLTHDYQSEVDLSATLDLGRAVLVGQVAGQLQAPLEIEGAGAASQWDQQITLVRIILPVRSTARNEP